MHIAEFINYKFNAIASRVRRDMRDIDPMEDVKCIRLTTNFYEAIIGLGGKPDREFMIFVTQKTPDSIPRPPKKPKLTSVYVKPTNPMKPLHSRKDPVKDLQLELFGITTDAAEKQVVQQQLDEERTVKIAEMETSRKYDNRVRHLAKVTSKALQAANPQGQQMDRMVAFRKRILDKRQKDREAQKSNLKLPEIPKKIEQIEAFSKMGYHKPRMNRRVSIYDSDGYKIRGDVAIGYRPIIDPVLFPMKKTLRKKYKPRGVFQKRFSIEDKPHSEKGSEASTSKKEDVRVEEEDDEDEFRDI
ncbi:uncharacterized protein LOC106660982 isoform X2 [Cimex lectularius]|nr:uncharacterized protein LOC106660982 isoform X2 [Cimex lectularius]